MNKKRPPPPKVPLPSVEFRPVVRAITPEERERITVLQTKFGIVGRTAICIECGHGAGYHGNETGTQSGKGRCWMRINTENPPKDLHELIVGEACPCKEYK